MDSIHPQLSIEFKNAQFEAQTKKIWPFEAEKGEFPRTECNNLPNLRIFNIPNVFK